MKKLFSFALFIFTLSAIFIPSKAATNKAINVEVNDTYISMDASPYIVNGTTFVPIRFVSEALGAEKVSWDHSNKTAILQCDGTNIKLPAYQKFAYVDGQYKEVNEGVRLSNNRTYVPVRFVSETLGADVSWNQATYTVSIDKDGVEVPDSLKKPAYETPSQPSYSEGDLYWLARLIQAEAQGEPMEGKIAVGNCIMNRVASSEFPNTVYGVIFDKKYGTQYTPTANGQIYNTPSQDSINAAKKALNGETVVGDSMYFLNPDKSTNFWIVNNRTFLRSIGDHDFYR